MEERTDSLILNVFILFYILFDYFPDLQIYPHSASEAIQPNGKSFM